MSNVRYLVGIDIGQLRDPTAVVVLEHDKHAERPIYRIRALHQYPLGTSYVSVADELTALFTQPPFYDNTIVAIDATGVGKPLVDLIKADPRLWEVYGLIITGSQQAGGRGYDRTVPKHELISKTSILFQQQRVRIPTMLEHTDTLLAQLRNFRARRNDNGHITYGPESKSDHDDLLLALSLALWIGEQRPATFPLRSYVPKGRLPRPEDRFGPSWL